MANKKVDMAALLKAKQAAAEARSKSPVVETTEETAEQENLGADALANSVPETSQAVAVEGRDRMAKIIDIRKINISSQVRGFTGGSDQPITQERIEELAELIQAESATCKIKAPIIIDKWDDQDTVWDGETRIRACMYLAEKLNDESIYFQPARYDTENEGKDQFERFLAQASINDSGNEIDLRTKLALILEAKKRGYSDVKIAKQMGKNRTTIGRISKIAEYPEEIQEMILSGDLPYTGRVLEKALKEAQAIEAPEAKASAQKRSKSVTEESVSDSEVVEVSLDEAVDEQQAPAPVQAPPQPTKEEKKAKIKAATQKKETVSVAKDSMENLVALVCMLAEKHGLEVDQPDFDSKAELKKFADNAQHLIDELEQQ